MGKFQKDDKIKINADLSGDKALDKNSNTRELHGSIGWFDDYGVSSNIATVIIAGKLQFVFLDSLELFK